jgi:hypothetical protein
MDRTPRLDDHDGHIQSIRSQGETLMKSPVLAACAVLFVSLVAVASWSQDDAVAAVASPTAAAARTVPAGLARDRQGHPVRVILSSPY